MEPPVTYLSLVQLAWGYSHARPSWKIVHMAYQYAQQQAAARTAEGKVQVVRNKPTTVIPPRGQGRAPADRKTTALRSLQRTGSMDDAVGAFMAGNSDRD